MNLKRTLRLMGLAPVFAVALVAANRTAVGQTVTAVPTLDFNQFTGSWYEIARLPNKREKICTGDVVEVIALGDKSKQLQIVTSCKTNKGYTEVRNATATTQKKRGDGELKVTYTWPFSEKDWVLAVGAQTHWVLIGSPNHKALWVYSRAPKLSPEVRSEIERKAAAEGFAVAKLVTTPQSGR
jgi:apolipoprotein D and lipocalin family protein